MKLNAKLLKYMTADEFRTLTATEMGMKNHEVVPTDLINSIANLKSGNCSKVISQLARNNLIARVQNIKYDGYRLTYGGYDYLALRAFAQRDAVVSVGQQIGVGKESDIYVVADGGNVQKVLKIQRLGRISFRTVKTNRDYLRHRKSASWMYLSRLAAIKEYAFLKVLYDNGFPVPQPFDQNRHCVVMQLIDGTPLYQVGEVSDADKLYQQLMALIVKLANYGLVHGDFNEFNLLIDNDENPIMIDFPQMVSTSHENAQFYFERDVQCVVSFFKKRFRYESEYTPDFKKIALHEHDLDVQVAASGFKKKHQKDIDQMLQAVNLNDDDQQLLSSSSDDEQESESER
ncbi:hypothetical protein MIR68_008015 [Amoeboaphelidium protococcarum]|nr:hypothetical protein MIR68_008015 [Amoeboaphelidium protococcarum]